jgi:hypothetical protein
MVHRGRNVLQMYKIHLCNPKNIGEINFNLTIIKDMDSTYAVVFSFCPTISTSSSQV